MNLDELLYKLVERRQAGEPDFVEIANVGQSVTEYRDFGLEPLTEYIYRVRAYSLLIYSEYSNEASAFTLDDFEWIERRMREFIAAAKGA